MTLIRVLQKQRYSRLGRPVPCRKGSSPAMKTMQVLTIATLLVGLAASSNGLPTDAQPRSSGGTLAFPGQFPWHVAVTTPNKEFLGSGALVSYKFILTAASVVSYEEDIMALLGTVSLSNGVEMSVMNKVLREGWEDEDSGNDLALLELNLSTLNLQNDKIQPVRLPLRSFRGATYAGQTISISGWGGRQPGDSLQNYLTISNEMVIKNKQCQNSIEDISKGLPWTSMCTLVSSEGGQCEGDNGNPAVFQEVDDVYTLVGIVSSTTQCHSSEPSVLARITEHLDWIANNSDAVVE